MSIVILKRTRELVTDPWGEWLETTDTAPFEDTDLVQYKVDSVLDVSDVTNATEVGNGTGAFDVFMQALDRWILREYDAGRITGKEYAMLLINGMQLAMTQGTQWARTVEITNSNIEKTKCDTEKACIEAEIARESKQDKIDMIGYQADKVLADGNYVVAQQTAMEEQVIDNRKIKALDSLADTYGTFGAGGLTLSSDMWTTYFSIVSDLSTATAPTSTTVTKVT